MGFLNKLLGKKETPPQNESGTVHLAFVLLSKPRLPSADIVASCYHDFAPAGENITESKDEGSAESLGDVLSFQFDSGETAFIVLVPAPVPNREADEGAQFSVSSLGTGWKLPEHSAHLVVTMPPSVSHLSSIALLSRFTSLLAAVAKTSDSVGIYWGNASATHDSEFFTSVASEPGVVPRIMLWTGLSIATEHDGRLSILSLGMKQLDLPDLLLVVSESSKDGALGMFFDLLAFVANRGEALPEGDTVGRTAGEKLKVHYVRSPINSGKKVWRVEAP
jgi:hypothetical protein